MSELIEKTGIKLYPLNESYFLPVVVNNQYINRKDELEQIIIISKQNSTWMNLITIEEDKKSYYQGCIYGYDILLKNDVKQLANKLSEDTMNIFLQDMQKYLLNNVSNIDSINNKEYVESFTNGCISALNNFYRLLFTDKESEVLSELRDSVNEYFKWSMKALKEVEENLYLIVLDKEIIVNGAGYLEENMEIKKDIIATIKSCLLSENKIQFININDGEKDCVFYWEFDN